MQINEGVKTNLTNICYTAAMGSETVAGWKGNHSKIFVPGVTCLSIQRKKKYINSYSTFSQSNNLIPMKNSRDENIRTAVYVNLCMILIYKI